jgi:hypothetical protein
MAEKAPFLASLGDTAAVIEKLREELSAVERQRHDLDEKANDLTVRISAFNTMRQAHGLAPA